MMKIQNMKIDLNKSWQWLFYISIILPLLFFILALLMGENTMGRFFSYLFSSYLLYIVNPFTNFQKMQGIVGIAIPTFLMVWSLRRRDYKDFFFSALIFATTVVAFFCSIQQFFIRIISQ